MNRRTFTKSCFLSFGCATTSQLLYSCQSNYYTAGRLESNGLSVAKSEFNYLKKDKPMIRQYIIVRNEKIEFPIYLYRFSENEYSAVLMKCTHQGNELQASGDHLHCPAHGSEYNKKGIVAQGPAEKNLRSFKISSDKEKIFIDLRS